MPQSNKTLITPALLSSDNSISMCLPLCYLMSQCLQRPFCVLILSFTVDIHGT